MYSIKTILDSCFILSLYCRWFTSLHELFCLLSLLYLEGIREGISYLANTHFTLEFSLELITATIRGVCWVSIFFLLAVSINMQSNRSLAPVHLRGIHSIHLTAYKDVQCFQNSSFTKTSHGNNTTYFSLSTNTDNSDYFRHCDYEAACDAAGYRLRRSPR